MVLVGCDVVETGEWGVRWFVWTHAGELYVFFEVAVLRMRESWRVRGLMYGRLFLAK